MGEKQPEGNVVPQQPEFQQAVDDELAFPDLKLGDAWGESIAKKRAAELEVVLQQWETEKEHGERRGPFDRETDDVLGMQLSGADVFWLAVRAAAGRDEVQAIATAARLIRSYPFRSDVNLDTLHLEGANLRQTHLEGANLSHAHLEGAFLYKALLRRAHLHSAHLELADLSNAKAKQVDLDSAHLEFANLGFAQLEKASMGHIHLEGANLVGASLKGSFLDEAQLQGATLSEAHLEGADLSAADLGAKRLSADTVRRLRQLGRDYQEVSADLQPARLEEAYLDVRTRLIDTELSNERGLSVTLADVRWNDFNLSTIDWSLIEILGDEYAIAHDKSLRYGEDDKSYDWRVRAYPQAARAFRQLAVALQAQGMNEEAARFAYRSRMLERKLLWRQAYSGQIELHRIGLRQRARKLGAYILSLFLNTVSGYGYRPFRSLIAYVVIVCAFAGAYLLNAQFAAPHLTWDEALVLSISAFHGRGFFTSGISLGDTLARLAAGEAIIGLLIEVTFIATFTQRFFAR